MRHVAPHRWADADAGRLSPVEVSRLEQHAARCERCANAREQVLALRDGFAALRDTPAPHLNWDHIGARIHWVTSSERRAATREMRAVRSLRRHWRWGLGAVGVAAVAAAALVVWMPRGGEPPAVSGAAVPAGPVTSGQPDAPAPAVALAGIVTFVQGDVELDGAGLDIAHRIGPGARLHTGNGRMAFQIEAGSGIQLEPRSTLQLRAFDEQRVELAVDGEVAIELAPRRADQRFAVIAGDRVVTVRGTAFRVRHRDGRVEVDCSRGRVVVSAGDTDVDVLAGHSLRLAAGESLSGRRSQLMDAGRTAEVEAATALPLLPAWHGADGVAASSAAIELAGLPRQPVEVDGVVRGTGSFVIRVPSGRHHVRYGARGTGSWLELGPGSRGAVHPPLAAAGPGSGARPAATAAQTARVRRAQLAALARDGRVRECLTALDKQGLLEGAYVDLDVGVNPDGSFRYLNIAGSNVSSPVARCVREAVDVAGLPRGPAASFRHKLAF